MNIIFQGMNSSVKKLIQLGKLYIIKKTIGGN